jgi:hypothetical protein
MADIENNLKVLVYESFWTQTAVTFDLGVKKLRITCKEVPCIWLASQRAKRIHTMDNEEIFYGEDIDINFIAPDEGMSCAKLHMAVNLGCPEDFEGVSNGLVNCAAKFIGRLSGGIHWVEITYETLGKTAYKKSGFGRIY